MVTKKFVTYPELLSSYGIQYSRKHLLDLQRRGLFPKALQLSPNRIGWLEAEIRDWLASHPVARSVGEAPDRPRAPVDFRRGRRVGAEAAE